MRLRDIQQVLNKRIDELQIAARDISGSIEIRGSGRVLEAIEDLKDTGIFKQEIATLLSESMIVDNVAEPIVVPNPIYQNFQSALGMLHQKATVFLEVLNEFIGEQDPHSIGVKLPPGLDLQKTADTILDLNKLLEQALVNPDTDGTITLQGFDRGSEWLEVGLGSKAALSFFSRMVQFYYRVKEKGVEIEKQREQARTMRLGNDLMEEVNQSLTRNFETYHGQESNKLLGKNNEQNERIKLSLDLLKTLMDKGLQIRPSLSAPEETKLSFSPPEQIEQVKQISNQEEEEEHTDQNDKE